MANKNPWNKCDKCGKFVAINDIDEGIAFREFSIDWDNYYEKEIEHQHLLCANCYIHEKTNKEK